MLLSFIGRYDYRSYWFVHFGQDIIIFRSRWNHLCCCGFSSLIIYKIVCSHASLILIKYSTKLYEQHLNDNRFRRVVVRCKNIIVYQLVYFHAYCFPSVEYNFSTLITFGMLCWSHLVEYVSPGWKYRGIHEFVVWQLTCVNNYYIWRAQLFIILLNIIL